MLHEWTTIKYSLAFCHNWDVIIYLYYLCVLWKSWMGRVVGSKRYFSKSDFKSGANRGGKPQGSCKEKIIMEHYWQYIWAKMNERLRWKEGFSEWLQTFSGV